MRELNRNRRFCFNFIWAFTVQNDVFNPFRTRPGTEFIISEIAVWGISDYAWCNRFIKARFGAGILDFLHKFSSNIAHTCSMRFTLGDWLGRKSFGAWSENWANLDLSEKNLW